MKIQTRENEDIAWKQWIAYRKRNSSMTIEEEQEIMEEMGVFDDYSLTEPDELITRNFQTRVLFNNIEKGKHNEI